MLLDRASQHIIQATRLINSVNFHSCISFYVCFNNIVKSAIFTRNALGGISVKLFVQSNYEIK